MSTTLTASDILSLAANLGVRDLLYAMAGMGVRHRQGSIRLPSCLPGVTNNGKEEGAAVRWNPDDRDGRGGGADHGGDLHAPGGTGVG